jgi:hypothetical protein
MPRYNPGIAALKTPSWLATEELADPSYLVRSIRPIRAKV